MFISTHSFNCRKVRAPAHGVNASITCSSNSACLITAYFLFLHVSCSIHPFPQADETLFRVTLGWSEDDLPIRQLALQHLGEGIGEEL
jgi:hypothetical protein